MGRTPDYKKKSRQLIEELHKKYPTYDTGRHIDTAFSEYGSIWGLSEKEFCFALEKYMAELELDENNIVSDDYLKEIEEDAKHLFDEPTEEDEY